MIRYKYVKYIRRLLRPCVKGFRTVQYLAYTKIRRLASISPDFLDDFSINLL